jgi:hypothetical protein
MIYRNSYFSKELRQAYIENRIGTKRKLAFAFFLGLISFAVHFTLQTLTESVLSDVAPHLMQPSYFSTVYTYNMAAFVLYVLYFTLFYDYMSFSEIRKNRWYLLVKMSYKPLRMIGSKLAASAWSICTIYATGFAFILFLTVFLKYRFLPAYLPALFFAGLTDLLVFTVAAMAASLYIRSSTTARYLLLLLAAFLLFLRQVLGYHTLVTDRIAMQNLLNLLDFHKSLYLPAAGGIVLASLAICFLKAGSVANYYSIPFDMQGYTLPEGKKLVRVEERTGRILPLSGRDTAGIRSRILDAAVTASLILLILSALAFNVFILLLSASQPGREVTIRGVIPYVFQSDTMEPAIMKNDLAYFKRIDARETVGTGDIVLFLEKNVVYVERVAEQRGNSFLVDIDKYPPMSQTGVMRKTVDRSAIYGLFTHSNRWLGALILFANTIFGRLAFLFGPALLLFFYQPVKNVLSRNIQKYMDE